MLARRIFFGIALAVAAVAVPATAASATVGPPGPGGALLPHAVLDVPGLIRSTQSIEFRFDASTGAIVEQELRVDSGADPNWFIIVTCHAPNCASAWARVYFYEVGTYTATLTVTNPFGLTDSVTHGITVLPALQSGGPI